MKARSASHVMAARGFSLVELMVAMVIGLFMTIVMGAVFLGSKSGMHRHEQLSVVQHSVRTAFEYLAHDARMVGHRGCFTGSAMAGFASDLNSAHIGSNYALGVEGFEYDATKTPFPWVSATPVAEKTASNWKASLSAPGGIKPIPIDDIAGTGDGLTPGADVLVVRTVSDSPLRLAASTTVGAASISIENRTGGTCSDGSTAKASGFCANSHGLIASCKRARVFGVQSLAGTTPLSITLSSSLAADPVYDAASTQVFPMQTIVYYVKASSSGDGTSLYRRIFDGDPAAGTEEELIEGVETVQVTYGVDTTTPADGAVDDYVTADAVTDWSLVVAVRMGVVVRAFEPVTADTPVRASDVVNGAAVTYPSTPKFDRRVFTTTVALRNRISHL